MLKVLVVMEYLELFKMNNFLDNTILFLIFDLDKVVLRVGFKPTTCVFARELFYSFELPQYVRN